MKTSTNSFDEKEGKNADGSITEHGYRFPASVQESNTPEVDAMICPVPGRDVVTGQPIEVVHADDARVLERQRDNARRQIAALVSDILLRSSRFFL